MNISTQHMDIELYSPEMEFQGTFTEFQEPSFVSDLGDSSGSFKVSRANSKLLRHPEWFAHRNVAKCIVDGKAIGMIVIDQKKPDFITSGESSEEAYLFAGLGARVWFKDAHLEPSNGLLSGAATNRGFNFSSERGDWYNDDEWVTPTIIHQYSATLITQVWSNAPSDWPSSASSASWVWGTYNDQVTLSPAGINYFRYELEVTEADGEGDYTIYATGHDQFQVFVDGAMVSSSTEVNPELKTWKANVHLSVGKHVIASRVLSTGGKAAFISAVYRDSVIPDAEGTLLSYTGDGNWLVNSYPTREPGWSVGEIIARLFSEAEARGIWFPRFLSLTFTSLNDSNGNAWPEPLDWLWDIGTDYYDIVKSIEEAGFESWIDPDTMTYNMVPVRGENRSIGGLETTKIFEEGKNLVRAAEEITSVVKNHLLVQTTEGWFETSLNAEESQEKYGRIDGFLKLDTGLRIGQVTAEGVLASRLLPKTTVAYQFISHANYVPHQDYFEGDWVLAPNSEGELVPRRIVSITTSVDSDTGRVIYEGEFDTQYQDLMQRLDERLSRLDHGSLGGSVANASRGSSIRAVDSFTDSTIAKSGELSGSRGYQLMKTLYFDNDGTFRKADFPGLKAVEYEVTGDGGAGGASATNGRGSGGGGAGATARGIVTDIAGMAASVAITIGLGGAGVTGGTGNAGTGASFGTYGVAGGGLGGGSVEGGLGGTATAGDELIPGGDGGAGGASGTPAGSGGGSIYGSGGAGAYQSTTTNNNGEPGRAPGSGGGGAFRVGASRTGGNGAKARVKLKLYS